MLMAWNEDVPERDTPTELTEQIADNRKLQQAWFKQRIAPQDTMSQAIDALNELCGAAHVVTADAGNHLLDVATLYEPLNIGGMFLDLGIRAMGNGICFTTGMAMAQRDKYHIAVTGDGCMLMNGNVMYLAKKWNLPILFLVFNNKSLGRVRVGQMEMNGFVGTDLGDVDFCMYGKAMGLNVYRVDTLDGYLNVMKEVLSAQTTALVEFLTDQDEIPAVLKG